VSVASAPPEPIARWYRAVEANDMSDLEDMLTDDATFSSPAVHTPQIGKPIVAKYLRAAMVVLNNPTFRYTGEWFAGNSAVLEFELTIDGIHVNGVDLIAWDDGGRITTFKVMVRPLKGLTTVVERMGRELQPQT